MRTLRHRRVFDNRTTESGPGPRPLCLPLLAEQGVKTVGELLHLQHSGRVRDRLRRLGLAA